MTFNSFGSTPPAQGRCSPSSTSFKTTWLICSIYSTLPFNCERELIVSQANKVNKQQMAICCPAHIAGVSHFIPLFILSRTLAVMSKQSIMLQLEQESFFLKAWDIGTTEWCKSISQPTVLIVIHCKVLFLQNCSSFLLFKCGKDRFTAWGNAVEISLQCTHAGENVGCKANWIPSPELQLAC